MARLVYRVPLPNGKVAEKVTPAYVEHSIAVIALLKLKRRLPPLNPDDKAEEPRYHRHQDWVLIGTTDTQRRADSMAENHGYVSSVVETRFVPVVGEPYVKAGAEDEDEGEA